MHRRIRRLPTSIPACLGLAAAVLALSVCSADISENLLKNPSFEEGFSNAGVPNSWSLYQSMDDSRKLLAVDSAHDGKVALVIQDDDEIREVGVLQVVPAAGGECYESSVMVRGVPEGTTGGSFMQLRFSPSGEFSQVSLVASGPDAYTRVATKAVAPEGTTTATIYLYTHAGPTPKVMVDSVQLVSGVEPPPPPPPPPPKPIPPQYSEVKDLHLSTPLVAQGEAKVTIVAPASGLYDELAFKIRDAVRQITGVRLPVAADNSPNGTVPITGNLILLGNRSTNETIGELYNRYYCLLDLKYPGAGGYVVRSLHNPFGDGNNVIFVGGSDDAGVAKAVNVLVDRLQNADGAEGALSVGRLAEIALGEGVTPPEDVRDMETWDASAGYGSVGYFGWCSISKQMAMYYMTGKPEHAKEFLRLALLLDDKAKQDISDIDGERIENKEDPLAGFYHYNAHMAILFWDLIEESPVFTDEERLKVTNAFARQLNHRIQMDGGIYDLTRPGSAVGSRHGQWSAVSLFCLGRYFNTYYPHPVWNQCVKGAWNHFAALRDSYWVHGESDNLFWYTTGTAPILNWMLLSGDRGPLESGSLQKLLQGQEMLISGLKPDWALNSGALTYFNQAAYLMNDGRWITYRERTGMNTDGFRLGQSYWPDPSIQATLPTDLIGHWSVHQLPTPAWESRGTGFPEDESYYFASFRSEADDTGDFVLLDGFNGASRNPYHTHAILELRLGGHTLLKGYHNQLLTRADGMVEPRAAMDAAVRWRDVVGKTAAFVADVPQAAYCNWRRDLAQRVGEYALVVDDLTFRADSDNVQVQTLWETGRGIWDPATNVLAVQPSSAAAAPVGWQSLPAPNSTFTGQPAAPDGIVTLGEINIVLLRATNDGDWIEFQFDVPETIDGDVFAEFLDYVDRGVVSISLDGETVVERYDNYAPDATPGRVSLGTRGLAAGTHKVRLEVVGRQEGAAKAYVGFRGLSVRPPNASKAPRTAQFEIRPADIMDTATAGRIATMEWVGPVAEGEHRIFFSLISSVPVDGGLACNRISDKAAMLSLPEPALAVVDEYGLTRATLAIVASDHLFGHDLLSAGLDSALLEADQPVDVDWDYETGVIEIVAGTQTTVTIAAQAGSEATVDGRRLDAAAGAAVKVVLPPGRHELRNVRPDATCLATLTGDLAALVAESQTTRTEQLAARQAQDKPAAPRMAARSEASVGSWVTDMITIPSPDGELVCAAEKNVVHVIAQDGSEVRTLEADANIRVIHWWPEYKLLLVGCKDEKVIAFDEAGNRKWEFVSVMDPAVFEAAKTYWFKTAPGHEGVHGLDTGVFIDGKTQCFVGSACTLEIIDENGKLVKRTPVFWGPGKLFRLIPWADDTVRLLIAREPTDGERLAIVDNVSLAVRGSGFNSVPAGHQYVGSWAQMSRDHIFHVDMNGDDKKEIVSEINGVWNRVTIWDEGGSALYNANFGPGLSIPARNVRDLEITDFDGDGNKNIIVALSSGLVVALDNECNKVWSARMQSPPTVLLAVTPEGAAEPTIIVGCENGDVAGLDAQGELVRLDAIDGRPTCIKPITLADGTPAAVISTNKGAVKTFSF